MYDALPGICNIIHDEHFLARHCIVRKRIPDRRPAPGVCRTHIMLDLEACQVVQTEEITEHAPCKPSAPCQCYDRIGFVFRFLDIVCDMHAEIINIIPVRYNTFEFIWKYHTKQNKKCITVIYIFSLM